MDESSGMAGRRCGHRAAGIDAGRQRSARPSAAGGGRGGGGGRDATRALKKQSWQLLLCF